MKKNIAKLLALAIISSGVDISKINKPVLDIKGNLIYQQKKLNDPDFIDFLTQPINKSSEIPSEGYNFLNYSLYEISKKPKENNQSIRDYLTQELTTIQALKDSIENKN